LIALVTPSLCGAYQISYEAAPGTSDPMWNAMQWINETQSNDTVITSWWDFGYLFEIAADKQVTFDGGSQTGSRAFWLGKAMSTDNLDLSVGIFRMLDTTGERSTEFLVNITGDSGNSVDILLDILPKSSDDAQKTLVDKYKLTSQQASDLVKLTHPSNPRPVIFVASSDMLTKAGWWSYFGSWDFKNQSSENYNYMVPTSTVEVKPGQSSEYIFSNADGAITKMDIHRGSGNNSTTAQMDFLRADTGQQVKINDTVYNPYNASNIVVIEDGQLMKNESIKGAEKGNFTIFLVGNKDQYTPFVIHNELSNSMFTRLYLLGGAGQDQFTNVHNEPGVMLFKVNFDKTGSASGNSTSNSTSGN
jgi:dolichyl-diphosphooligosaccharide--protein glycosyltransferase